MKFKLEITMDNAAFVDSDETPTGFELARILRKIAGDVNGAYIETTYGTAVQDLNGTTVGKYTIT